MGVVGASEIGEETGAAQTCGPDLSNPPEAPQPTGVTRRMTLVFAVACGLVVANLYYAQPMLNTIARDFRVSSGAVGLIVTLTQMGYALGLLFVVPLGDLLNRRWLVTIVLLGTTLALIAAAFAPTLAALAAISLAIGLTSVVAQVLIPFAANLARDEERGRVVGAVMSGLLIGVLLARVLAGLLNQVLSWRAIYMVAAGLMLAMLLLLQRELPWNRQGPRATLSYGALLASLGELARQEPVLRRRSLYGGLVFGAFSVLWTSLAFLLARPPYGFGQAVIGLFGLFGVAGASMASLAGRLADRGLARSVTGASLGLLLVSFALVGLGAHMLLALIAGILLLDLAVQGTHITNQSEIYKLRPEARSRLTTVYMVTYFVGGALGSALSAWAYGQFGWGAVALVGASFASLGVLLWLTELLPARRTQRQ